MRHLATLALLVGCGRIGFSDGAVPSTPDASADASAPLVPAPPPYASGTRLRAEIYEIGAVRRFATWFDTQRGEPCAAAVAEDGVTRCLPSEMSVGVQYTDAACTIPLIVGEVPMDKTDCPSSDTHARYQVGERTRIVQVGAPYTGTVYQAQQGSCVMVGNAPWPYYQVGATVDPASFVALHDELTRSGDLAYIEQVGDDGARLLDTDHLVVAATGVRGAFYQTSHDELQLVPDDPRAGLVYSEPTCTDPAVFVQGAATATHALIAQRHDTCSDALFDATLGVQLTTFYQRDGSGGCTAATLPTGDEVYRATSLVPLQPLAIATLGAPAGQGVVAATWTFSQGQTLPGGFYDASHGDQCLPITLASTYERVCAPIWDSRPAVFRDQTCTTEIDGYPHCRGNWRATWYPDALASFTCDGFAWQVYAYDQPIAGPYYEERDGTTCALADPGAVAPLGPDPSKLPAAEMAPVARRMD